MKKIFVCLLLLGCFCWVACSDDKEGAFGTAISEDMFSFTPVEGGAVMHYKLTDRRVNKVKVEYTDEYGLKVYKTADYAVDSIVLNGFNQVYEDVPVRVSFLDKNEKESDVLHFAFNTRASNLYTFFDVVKVNSYWNGFQVIYDLKGRTEGSASVFFVGINPTTKVQDTLFLENFLLEEGRNVKAYSIDDSQLQDAYTVVITTEDDRQRIVRKQVWNGVEGVDRLLIPSKDFELIDPFNKSKEMEYNSSNNYNPGALGKAYLFDGDTKGTTGAEYYKSGKATPPFAFLAGPNALWRPDNDVYFVLDLQKPMIVGEMRLYMKYVDGYAANKDFDNDYYTKLPCDMQVFAWVGEGDYNKDTNPGTAEDWEEVGRFKQEQTAENVDRWYNEALLKPLPWQGTKADVEARKPVYLSIPFPFEERECRFFKIQFNETFLDVNKNYSYNHNNNNNVTVQELEVYGQK